MESASPLYAEVEETRDRAADLLAIAREARIPVFHTNVEFEPGGVNGGIFYRKLPILKVFERGSPLGAFAQGLEPLADEPVITKQYASAFFGTSLAATLTAAGIDTVLIGGVTTSGCIRATTVDACQHGFIPYVVEDASGDRHEDPHRANIFDLSAKYAEITTTDKVPGLLASTG